MVVKAGVGDTHSKILKTYASYSWITENKWEYALSLNLKNLFMSIHRQQRTNMQASPKWREIFYSVYGAADVKTNKSKSFASEKDRHLHFLLFYNSTVFISVLSVSIAHHSIQSTSRYSHPPNLLKVTYFFFVTRNNSYIFQAFDFEWSMQIMTVNNLGGQSWRNI